MYVFIEMREIKNGARKKSRDVVVDTLLVNRKCCVSSSSFLFTPTKLTGKKKLIFCWPRGRQVKTCLTATQFLVFYFHPSTLHEVAFLATFITPSTLTAPALSKKILFPFYFWPDFETITNSSWYISIIQIESLFIQGVPSQLQHKESTYLCFQVL